MSRRHKAVQWKNITFQVEGPDKEKTWKEVVDKDMADLHQKICHSKDNKRQKLKSLQRRVRSTVHISHN